MDFYDREDCITLSPYIDEYGTKSGIFVFKNFIKQEYVEKIEKQLSEQKVDFEKSLLSWYKDKISPGVDGLIDVWEQIGDLLYPNWVIHPQNSFITLNPGDDGMFIHSDSPGKNACHLLSQMDIWSTCCLLDYGVIAYFGDFEGGEVFYPGINKDGTVKTDMDGNTDDCLEYKPESGDLVIHSAFQPYSHGVREVKSGTRYAFSNFCIKAKDNPGSFYNYKTKEYYEQIKNKTEEDLSNWIMPLKINPQFTDEKISIYKESGLEGDDLAKKFFQDMKE